MPRLALLPVIGFAIGFGFAPSEACAQVAEQARETTSGQRRALELFDEGAEAFAEDRFFDAITLFLEGDGIAPSPAFAYNIALAYRQVGDWARTLRWSRAYLRRAEGHEEPVREMKALVVEAEKKVAATGLQQVTILSDPAGATVGIDGTPAGVTPWTGELEPGSHRVELRLPGYGTTRGDIELTLEHASERKFRLRPSPAAPSTKATDAPAGDDESPAVFISSLVLMGVGLGGMGAGLGLELKRRQVEEDALSAPTQLQARDALQVHDDYRLGSRIGLGAGAALLAVGSTMLIVDLAAAGGEASADAPRAGVWCDTNGCRGSLRLSF